MRNVVAITSVTLGLLLSCGVPALSADSTTKTGGVADGTTETKAVNTAKPATAQGGVAATVATRVSSMVLGSIVGVPVSIVRRSKAEAVIATKELVGDSPKWWQVAVGAPLGVPAGMVSGLFQGILYGPYNAYKYGDKPFSAEAFSLANTQ